MALQSSYIIEEAILSNFLGIQIDIKGSIVGLELFENMAAPYIHGRVTFIDDFNLKSLQLKGTEELKIKISYSGSTANDSIAVNKRLIISRVESQIKLDDYTEVNVFHVIEDSLFIDSLKQISKSYKGPIEKILENIAETELDRAVVNLSGKSTAQGLRRVLVPYMSPIQAMQWITARATTERGFPFILYSSIFSGNNIFLNDVETLANKTTPPRNASFPLVYSQSQGSVEASREEEVRLTQIVNYRRTDVDDTLSMILKGAIGSSYSNTDIFSGTTLKKHQSIRTILDELVIDGVLDRNGVGDFFDEYSTANGYYLDDYNSYYTHKIDSGKTYLDSFLPYSFENRSSESGLRTKADIVRALFARNALEIQVNGAFVFTGKIGVGDKIRCHFLSNAFDPTDSMDRRMSGDYVVTANRITMENPGEIAATMAISKLSDVAITQKDVE